MPCFIIPFVDIEQVAKREKGLSIQYARKIFYENNISYLMIRKRKCAYHEVTIFTEDDLKMKSLRNISTQNAIKGESF